MSTHYRFLPLTAVSIVALCLSDCAAEENLEIRPFDVGHVEAALVYLEAPSEAGLLEIAETAAARHLVRHSEVTGYYPSGTSALDITRDLLHRPFEPELVVAVRELLAGIEAAPERQIACQEEAARYLPEGTRFREPLYLTWGYDIGVAMNGSASLNLAHPHFTGDPEELWYYCTHEMHHAGLTALQPFPMKIAEITTADQMLELVRYATMLEGMAVHAARAPRTRAGALDRDPDYVALQDPGRMAAYADAFWQIYERFALAGERELEEDDWQAVERLSDGDRLWYRVGASMAVEIETELGIDVLRQLPQQGPDAFFERYATVRAAKAAS